MWKSRYTEKYTTLIFGRLWPCRLGYVRRDIIAVHRQLLKQYLHTLVLLNHLSYTLPGYMSDIISDPPSAFYDPMNYAPDIKCPVFMNRRLIDSVSPPLSVWTVYNRLGTDKRDWSAVFDIQAWRWLDAIWCALK